ncbi:hypothetical protein ACFL0U_04275 [Pseudomonadota bacterium]
MNYWQILKGGCYERETKKENDYRGQGNNAGKLTKPKPFKLSEPSK